MNQLETWLPVVGYEGLYEVSDHGRVRSLDRVIMRSNGSPQRIHSRLLGLNRIRKAGGHVAVALHRDGVAHETAVHQLVLKAFVGPRPRGMESLHDDGNPANNEVSNLSWGTHLQNMRDTIRHGTSNKKDRCKRGHALRAPNLLAPNQCGHQACLACNRGHGTCRHGSTLDLQAASDQHYVKIIRDVVGYSRGAYAIPLCGLPELVDASNAPAKGTRS